MASSGSSVAVSSGSRTFSSNVIEPNSAPDWYITPKRDRMRSRVSLSEVTMSASPNRICPRIGRSSPIMFLRIVLLPEPDPPRMPNTSPRRTSKFTLVRIGTPS